MQIVIDIPDDIAEMLAVAAKKMNHPDVKSMLISDIKALIAQQVSMTYHILGKVERQLGEIK